MNDVIFLWQTPFLFSQPVSLNILLPILDDQYLSPLLQLYPRWNLGSLSNRAVIAFFSLVPPLRRKRIFPDVWTLDMQRLKYRNQEWRCSLEGITIFLVHLGYVSILDGNTLSNWWSWK